MTNTMISSASNADVVKLYGARSVMRRAWATFKYMPGYQTFSKALSFSWASFRGQINRSREEAATFKKRAAAYKGGRNVRSPLNPHVTPRHKGWGVHGNAASASVMASR